MMTGEVLQVFKKAFKSQGEPRFGFFDGTLFPGDDTAYSTCGVPAQRRQQRRRPGTQRLRV